MASARSAVKCQVIMLCESHSSRYIELINDPEELARKNIDKLLAEAGWKIQDMSASVPCS